MKFFINGVIARENMKVFNTPIYACIDLTYKCNFSCRHCMFLNENLKEYTTAQIINLLDRLEDEKFVAVQFFFSGGEPLLEMIFRNIGLFKSEKICDFIGNKWLFDR